MSTTPTKADPIFSPRTQHLVKNYAIAGGSAGLGLAAITSAANYIKYLKQKADRSKDTSHDDDTMYVDVPLDKKASIGGGIALAGGTMSAILAYMAGRKVYQKIKKKNLQNDLDEAQRMYMTTLTDEGMGKQASDLPKERKGMSNSELFFSSPLALSLLTGIASGVVANKTLNHYIPPADAKSKRSKPKKLQVRYTIGGKPIGTSDPVDAEESSDLEKAASDSGEVDFIISEIDRRQAVAFLCDIALSMEKSGSYLPDIVYAVAQGRLKELEDNVSLLGPSTALDMIKGASNADISLPAQRIAVNLILGSDVLRDTTAVIAAADIVDACPSFFKMASAIPETDAVSLFKIAAALGANGINDSLDTAMGATDEATPGDEGSYDRLEGIEEGQEQAMSPKKLLEMLLSREMQKTTTREHEKEQSGQEDVIDKMLASS